jgi:hypothetical protein
MSVENFSKIATVLMAGNGKQIDELGVLCTEEACYVLEVIC